MTAASHRPGMDARLVEYVLGSLGADERASLERELGPRLASELAATRDALTALSLALPPRRPPPALRDRLLASARGPARFAPFIDRVARFIDVASDKARELLASLEFPATWLPSPGPNIHLVHLVGGPACAAADVGFVRVAAGTTFPMHRHLGDEHVLVLQGGYLDTDGSRFRAGDTAFKPEGSSHEFTADPDQDLIYVTVFHGVEVPGIDLTGVFPPHA